MPLIPVLSYTYRNVSVSLADMTEHPGDPDSGGSHWIDLDESEAAATLKGKLPAYAAVAAPDHASQNMGCEGVCSECGASCSSTVGFSQEDRQVLLRLDRSLQKIASAASGHPTEQPRFLDEAYRVLAQLAKHHATNGDQTTPMVGEPDVSATLLRSGRSIAELQRATDGDLTWDSAGKYLHCKVCASDVKDPKKQRSGVFRYDVTVGTSFAPRETMPPRFKSLKQNVAEHFRSIGHKEAKKAHLEKTSRQEARVIVDNTAASHVLRSTYMVLKNSLGHTLFEELILLQHLNGTQVGNINHSRMMMATARTAFHQVIQAKIKEEVLKQPCVAVLADKVTVARRTVDVTAILMLLPAANAEDIFQSFVVGAPVVQQHDGEALADDIRGSLENVGVAATGQISAFAADGQYHHNDVPAKLARMLDGPSDLPAVWDPAHLMNLAESDGRGAVQAAWVQETIEVMTSVTKRFSYGKGWEDLKACGDQSKQKALRPKMWSETRFAAHAGEVFYTFRRNLPLLCTALEEKFKEEARPAQLKEMKKELCHLTGMSCQYLKRALE